MPNIPGRTFSPIGATPQDEEARSKFASAFSPLGGQTIQLPGPPRVQGVMPSPSPLLAGPDAPVGGIGRAPVGGMMPSLFGEPIAGVKLPPISGGPDPGHLSPPPPVARPIPQPPVGGPSMPTPPGPGIPIGGPMPGFPSPGGPIPDFPSFPSPEIGGPSGPSGPGPNIGDRGPSPAGPRTPGILIADPSNTFAGDPDDIPIIGPKLDSGPGADGGGGGANLDIDKVLELIREGGFDLR